MQQPQTDVSQQNPIIIRFTGVLDFYSVSRLLVSTCKLISGQQGRNIEIDMSSVDDCDSAAISLMFEIVNWSQTKGYTVRFTRVPGSLVTIARVYGIEKEFREICR